MSIELIRIKFLKKITKLTFRVLALRSDAVTQQINNLVGGMVKNKRAARGNAYIYDNMKIAYSDLKFSVFRQHCIECEQD